ncbi:MAG: hypothetical protein NTW31_13450 [Bacteroidetes bacterium]|nr:hypothetical protein [Bacteroidota bacterium]
MKKHFLSLLDPAHRWITLSFFLAAVILVIASQVIGTTDNLPGLAALLGGMVVFCFALTNPWRNPTTYAIMAGVCLGLIALTFLAIYILSSLHKTQYLSEGMVMGFIGLICLPGIVAGILGAIIWAIRKR